MSSLDSNKIRMSDLSISLPGELTDEEVSNLFLVFGGFWRTKLVVDVLEELRMCGYNMLHRKILRAFTPLC